MSGRGLEQSVGSRSDADFAPLIARRELGASEKVPRRAFFHQPARTLIAAAILNSCLPRSKAATCAPS